MTNTICLDEKYSTTRLMINDECLILNENENNSTLFLPEGDERKGEGGLRTQGYFKKSFEDKPLITIITIVFNGEKYLEETILSVLNQTYDNVEYIIIDGGSTDGTLDIVKKYEDRIDYWVSEKDRGISDAFNKGIKASNGDIIGIINSDDKYLPYACSDVAQVFLTNDCKYMYGNFILEDSNGKFLRELKPTFHHNFPYRGIPVGHPTLFVQKRVYDLYGLFNVNYKIAMDFEFFTRIYHLKSYYLDKQMARYKRGGMSDIYVLRGYREILAASLASSKSSFLKSFFYYYFGILRTSTRKILGL